MFRRVFNQTSKEDFQASRQGECAQGSNANALQGYTVEAGDMVRSPLHVHPSNFDQPQATLQFPVNVPARMTLEFNVAPQASYFSDSPSHSKIVELILYDTYCIL